MHPLRSAQRSWLCLALLCLPFAVSCGGLVDFGPEGTPGLDSAPGTDPPNAPPPAAPVELAWMRQFGSAGQDKASAIAFSSAGSVLVAGWTSLGEDEPSANLGKTDSFVRRYDKSGEVEWARQFGTTDSDGVYGAIGLGEDVVIAGYCRGALPGNVSVGDSDAYVSRLTADGTVSWTHQFGSTGYDVAYALAASVGGGFIVAGYVEHALVGWSNQGRQDAYVARFDAYGNMLDNVQFGSEMPDVAFAVCTFADGSFAVAGSTAGALEAGQHVGKEDAFVQRYGDNAVLRWSTQFGGPSKDVVTSAVCSPDGSVLVGGYFYGELDGQQSLGSYDGFLRRYDRDGKVLWTRTLGSAGADYIHALSADESSRIFVAGSTEGALAAELAGRSDSFVITLSESGDQIGGWQFGSSDFGEARAIAVSADGRVAAAGYTQGALPGQVASGAVDAFAAVLE